MEANGAAIPGGGFSKSFLHVCAGKHVLVTETQIHHYFTFEKPECVILLSQRETGALWHVNTSLMAV